MSLQAKRTIIIALTITSIVVAIGVLLPVIYSSSFYRNTTGIGAWTPLPSLTFTPTTEMALLPTQQPSSTATAPPPPTALVSCVFPADYWKARPELWPAELYLGGAPYTQTEMGTIFGSQSQGIREYILQNLYIAYLNVYTNADSTVIIATIDEANNWLQNNPPENPLTEDARQAGLYLAQTLIDFNTGLLGADICTSYQTQVLTPIIIGIMETLVPSETPSPTSRPTRRPSQVPTRTKNPTDKPPTRTPAPVTNTPQPPTSQPSPEPTQPPPTPIPTEEPSPTPVP